MSSSERPSTTSRPPNKKRSSKRPQASKRSSSSLQKTEVIINVYDLLPPGTISSTLWLLGSSLLHTGVILRDREYAYGGHSRPHTSGVYWTKPGLEPPGGTFRLAHLQGFTFRTISEIESIIREVSTQFMGTNYNLLSNNCNHFTSFLCHRLTGRKAPTWLNRASTIGTLLPCIVPKEWVSAPDVDTADGELLEEEEDDDERAAMLKSRKRGSSFRGDDLLGEEEDVASGSGRKSGDGKGKGKGQVRDTDGRSLPASERAPTSLI